MAIPKNFSAKISNYRCFGKEPQGFETFLPINVIIGRNNAGKSTLLDLVRVAITGVAKFDSSDHHKGVEPSIVLRQPLTQDELQRVFRRDTSEGPIRGNHWTYGSQWVGKPLTWKLGKTSEKQEFLSLEPPLKDLRPSQQQFETQMAAAKQNPLAGLRFRHLAAERDISPDAEEGARDIGPNGQNATRLFTAYHNRANLPRDLAKSDMLRELNLICSPDSLFDEIVTLQLDNNQWEISLKEKDKGTIPLSKTGSGFKTILLALMIIHLLPHQEQQRLSKYIFAFEELENNLHPAMLRRLLLYLRQKAIETGCTFLLTTHSNVVIDLFSKDENAQIIHVTHNKTDAVARRVTTYIESKGILEDLDVRASDLLQANGIIWVEGPSDRVYLNRWIALWSGGKLQEGTHYQCVFYGGKLLAHLSAEPEEPDITDPVNILRVNTNAVILIDSDKPNATTEVNATKRRIQKEIEYIGGISWITDGRAIENYLPSELLQRLYPSKTLSPVPQFEKFDDYLEKIEKELGTKFLRSKVLFAQRVCDLFEKDDIGKAMGLADRLDCVVEAITRWNRLGELTAD